MELDETTWNQRGISELGVRVWHPRSSMPHTPATPDAIASIYGTPSSPPCPILTASGEVDLDGNACEAGKGSGGGAGAASLETTQVVSVNIDALLPALVHLAVIW